MQLQLPAPVFPALFYDEFVAFFRSQKDVSTSRPAEFRRALKKVLKKHKVTASPNLWSAMAQKLWAWASVSPIERLKTAEDELFFLASKTGWKAFYQSWVHALISYKQEQNYCVNGRRAFFGLADGVFNHLFNVLKQKKPCKETRADQEAVVSPLSSPWVSASTRRWVGVDRLNGLFPRVHWTQFLTLEASDEKAFKNFCPDVPFEELQWRWLSGLACEWNEFEAKTRGLSAEGRTALALIKIWHWHRSELKKFEEALETPNTQIVVMIDEFASFFAGLAGSMPRMQFQSVHSPSVLKIVQKLEDFKNLNGLCRINPCGEILLPEARPKTRSAEIPSDDYLNDACPPKDLFNSQKTYGPKIKGWWENKSQGNKPKVIPLATQAPEAAIEVFDLEQELKRIADRGGIEEALELECFSRNGAKRLFERALMRAKVSQRALYPKEESVEAL